MVPGTTDVLIQHQLSLNYKKHTICSKIAPRLPSFPVEELQRINYGEGFVAERMQLLQQARIMAEQDSREASEKYKEQRMKCKRTNSKANGLIKNSIERRVTRSMKKINFKRRSVN